MKLLHLADLHLGKRVNGFSMIEEQKYILDQILSQVKEEDPYAVIIAGDVYDRSIPAEEAVDLFDSFLVRLSECKKQVFIISGNHDSAERIAFGGRLMNQSGIHFAPVYDGHITSYTLEDSHGPVTFWLIPFLKPANVRRFYQDENIGTYTDAMACVLRDCKIKKDERNIAIVHQFLLGGSVSDSEEHITVGGTEEVDVHLFDSFDYVALGHLHGPQKVGRETVRYAGSPLKYSFSECSQKKSATLVEMNEKGQVSIRLLPLEARRDLIRLRGTFDSLIKENGLVEEYCEITLTDEEDIPEAMNRLRDVYPNIMVLKYDNTRTRNQSQVEVMRDISQKEPIDLFDELYSMQNGQEMNAEQRAFVEKLIREIWEEEL